MNHEVSPGRLARMAGGLYLVNIVLGFFAIGVNVKRWSDRVVPAGVRA